MDKFTGQFDVQRIDNSTITGIVYDVVNQDVDEEPVVLTEQNTIDRSDETISGDCSIVSATETSQDFEGNYKFIILQGSKNMRVHVGKKDKTNFERD